MLVVLLCAFSNSKILQLRKLQLNMSIIQQKQIKDLKRSVSSPKDNFIQLNGRRNHSMMKMQTVREKINTILDKDYHNWRNKKINFNALASQTAKNSNLINQYVDLIYEDYQIKNPLNQPIRNEKSQNYPIQIQNLVTLKNFEKKQFNQKRKMSQRQVKNIFETPLKNHRRGIQLVNEQKQKQLIQNKKIELIGGLTDSKIENKGRFIERTASSFKSNYNLNNSQLQGFNLEVAYHKNIASQRQSLLNRSGYLAKSMHNPRNQQNFPNKIIETERKPITVRFNSSFQLQSQKQQCHQNKNISFQVIKSQQSLEANNPQLIRQKLTRQMHASAFLKQQQNRDLSSLKANKQFDDGQFYKQFESIDKTINKPIDKTVDETIDKTIHKTIHIPIHKPIKQSYRYCVGCQSAVLQANVQFHQQQCCEFKEIFGIDSVQKIIQKINEKVEKIIKDIKLRQNTINQNDSNQIIQSSEKLIIEIQNHKKQNQDQNPLKSKLFQKQYTKVMSLGNNWGLMTQEINKLKWFLMVKDNLQKAALLHQPMDIKSLEQLKNSQISKNPSWKALS